MYVSVYIYIYTHTLIFLALVFRENQGEPPKTSRIFSPAQCDEANYGLVGFSIFPCFAGIPAVWGLETQIHHLSFSTAKLALSTLRF